MVYIIKPLDHPKKGVSKIFVDYVDIVDKLIYNIIVKILQAPSRDKQLTTKEEKMKIKLLENDKIIEVTIYKKLSL